MRAHVNRSVGRTDWNQPNGRHWLRKKPTLTRFSSFAILLCMNRMQTTNASELQAECLALRMVSEANGLTQQTLALELVMSQAQVSRILSGQILRRSRRFKQLSVYVSRYRQTVDIDWVRQSDLLLSAIADAWDGSPEHELTLAAAIKSIGKFTRPNMNRRFKRDGPTIV
jgi:transcriptional regulator with XRE-family HTH domain